ncbi:MAG: GSCFA domain-containing protein [Flavobacteriales bacterium]|nr:GSCFA domain-containing protein [Flavobacteriales bacterium]
MNLITAVKIPHFTDEITYRSHLFFMGSCFAGNVGEKFANSKFDTVVNPFGVLFNPFSVLDSMERILTKRYFTEDDFFETDGRYLSLALHSDHSYQSATEAVKTVNELIDTLYEKLKTTTHIFYTFGTSQVFKYKKTGIPCANCHKIPQREFSVESLSVCEITKQAQRVDTLLRAINPCVKVYYTVSPVRYLNEGALGNNAGKGRLFCAIEDLVDEKTAFYFPAYEIVMDELRDYRFFAQDMVHPNALAVDYIWERIGKAFFSSETQKNISDVDALMRNVAHRPFNPNGEQYKSFCLKSISVIDKLREKCPFYDFSQEEDFFKKWL